MVSVYLIQVMALNWSKNTCSVEGKARLEIFEQI